MYKTYFEKNKKLVRTMTISIAILITATLILSGAVSAIGILSNSTKMNVKHQIPQGSGSAVDADPNAMSMPITAATSQQNPQPLAIWDIQHQFDVYAAAGVLGNTGAEWDGTHLYSCVWSSSDIHRFEADGTFDETFTISGVSALRDLAYDGTYFYGGAAGGTIWEMDFDSETLISTITGSFEARALAYDEDLDVFYASNWGDPVWIVNRDGSIAGQFNLVTATSTYGFAYDNTCDDGPYLWVFDQTGSPSAAMIYQWDLTAGAFTGVTHDVAADIGYGSAGGMFFATDYVTNYATLGCLDQGGLTTTPDIMIMYEICQHTFPVHDIEMVSIDSPTDDSELCGCLPVEVTVKNGGSSDEDDVPIHVTIRRYQFEDSFEDPLGDVWETNCGDCAWNLVTDDTGIPDVVDPRTGSYMAELNSGNGGMSGQCLLYEIDYEDFSDKCYPMMSFWMWHDTYGSDDYLEVWIDDGTGFAFEAGPYERHCCPGCDEGWMEHVVDLSDYAGETTVRIGFKGYCDPNPGAYNLHIDDVSKYDLEYDETEYIDIDSEEVVTVEFTDPWCPCQWQEIEDEDVDFEVIACAELDTDEIPSNDCKQEIVTLHFPFFHDVGAISIDEPVGRVPAGTFEMCSTIKNFGQFTECCFSTYMTVEEQYLLPGWTEWCEYFDSGVPPSGWTDEHGYGWYASYTTYCGGDSPEAMIQYFDCVANKVFYSMAFDTVGMTEAKCDFLQYVNHYGAGYTLDAGWSTDAVNWNVGFSVTPSASGQYPGSFNIPINEPVVYVGFWCTGDPFYFNYWYLDDVCVYQPDLELYYPAEWSNSYCIDDIEVCEELQLEFNTWTPTEPWPDCDTVTYRICAYTNMLDPPDEDSTNDMVCEIIEVDFYHDVGVKEITSPTGPRGGSTDWIQYSDETPENALGLTTAPNTITEAIKLTPDELGTYTNHEITQIRVYKGYPGYTFEHDYEVWMYTGAQPTDPDAGTVVATGTSPLANGWFEIDTDDYAFDPADTVWVGINWDHHTVSTFPIGLDESIYIAGKSSWFTYDLGTGWVAWAEYAPYTMMIGAGVEEVGGAPPPDIYIPCGPQDLSAIVENIGTFDETGLTCYAELYDWTDPENPTLVYEAEVTGINLDAGDEYGCDFGSYDFDLPGIYELIVEIPLTVDCYPDNNIESYGIGVDCCAPESEHELDPEYPDGENNWYVSDVKCTLDAIDPGCPDPCEPEVASGVKEIKYKVNDEPGTITGSHGTFTIDENGNNLVEYWAIDNVGNEEEHHTFTVAIDTVKPSVDLIYDSYQDDDGNWWVDFTAIASDTTSGMNRVEFYIDTEYKETDTTSPYEWTIQWEDGYKTKTFYAYAYDQAGNKDFDSIPGDGINSANNGQSQSQSQSSHSPVKQLVPRLR